jgi:hypothetical protein
VLLCQFLVLAGNRFWFYILLMYLEYNSYSCGVVLVFWFWREIVFGVPYVLSVQYSCVVVSVFWLWREIILKMRTPFYKKILLGYFIAIRYLLGFFIFEKQLFSQDMFLVRSKLSITAYLFLVLYRSTSLQSLLFLKNIKTFLCK